MENQTTKTNWERFNLWVFNFLAAVLPYSTPLPIAIYTAINAKKFLGLDPYTSGILVFGLEGIGLLCTSLLVDAIVEWVKSRNVRAFAPIILFGVIVFVYIRILISLNVTLEQAAGNNNAALANVVTLICYIPLISGVINGWNKLRIENRDKQERDVIHNESRADQLRREEQEREDRQKQYDAEQADIARREQLAFERERIRIQEEQKTERVRAKASQPVIQQPARPQETPQAISGAVASQYSAEMYALLTEVYNATGEVAGVKTLADQFSLNYDKNKGYISTLRKKWATEHNIILQRKSKAQ